MLPYAGLFVLSFLAATVLPLGSEATLVAVVAARGEILAPVLVATVGNVLGSCTTYWIGRRTAEAFVRRRGLARGEERAALVLRRYGGSALLISSLPVVGDALVALAGATGMARGPSCSG
ncbi:YqaA family protein [Rubrobacter marinus]|uniref:YqaA family protein n=1 Tax=Rubrobacter marinus TaxID=2653852 RepID=UPI001A9FC064|nr:VTT domain-containing protein [Rubrobacter marinus]